MRFRGQNPVYKMGAYERTYDDANAATYGGVVTKSSLLLGIIAITALYFSTTLDFAQGEFPNILPTLIGAPIIAIIAVIVTHRIPSIAPISAIVYSIAEGVFLGFISALYAWGVGGNIVQMALVGTFGVLAGMLFLYSTGVIRVGSFFRRLMMSMLMGLVGTTIIFLVLLLVGVSFEAFYSFYVGIVVFSVILSSLFLLVDFDNISKYVEAGAPKQAEWSLSLGLVVTIVWLYIELLRLIAIIANRTN